MFFETSAKNSHNIDLAFQTLARIIMEKTTSTPDKSNDFKLGSDNRKKLTATNSSTPGHSRSNDSCC